jgi:hypothetical protein
MTVGPSTVSPDKAVVTGRAAHVTAARKGGPRYDKTLTPEQRKSADNGLWLCADDADLVDKDSGKAFSVKQLRSWKRGAEQKQQNRALLRVQPQLPGWLNKISSPHYVNVPRLLSIAGTDTIHPDILDELRDGFPRGRFIVRELLAVENALRHASIKAVEVTEVTDPASVIREGLTISYYGSVWAKNVHSDDARQVQQYSFEHSPQIYTDKHRYRYIFPFDPAWLTTNTARNIGGRCTLAVIGMVKSVDHDKRLIIATPLTFGIPNLFDL